MAKIPGYCRHSSSGKAYVRLNGRQFYLGDYDSAESKEKYADLLAEWLRNPMAPKFCQELVAGGGITMSEMVLGYLAHAEKYYVGSAEYRHMKRAIVPISELYSMLPAREFSAQQYKTIRDWWLKDTSRSRSYVNTNMKRLVRVIRWAVSEDMMPAGNLVAIKCVEPLKYGRTTAKEPDRIKPVDPKLVAETIKHLTKVQSDMIRFQMLTGCRPGELVIIKPGLVDRSGKVWRITLDRHKTAYLRKSRVIYVGPKAQKILTKYLLRGADDYCFSPIESEKQRRQTAHERRVTRMSCGNVPGSNRIGRKPRVTPGERYTANSYYRFIWAACRRAKLTSWHPNQLRHLVGTEVRKKYGVEGSQSILGHSEVTTSQIYSEVDEQRAIQIATKLG